MGINELRLDHSAKNVKRFLQNDFYYFTNLYYKIRTCKDEPTKEFIHVYYNGLTQMDTQFQLILSACNVNDTDEAMKIQQVSGEVDRLFCLLQLQRSYDSNLFAEVIYKISVQLRGCEIVHIHAIFDEALLSILRETHNNFDLKETWNYSFFRNVGFDLDKRFLRYVLARVEQYIADNTRMEMKQYLYNLVVNRGAANGFHVEHVLAENEENYALFDHDEDLFRGERNRLGGLLLMKGPDNISSHNESYSDKLKSYANTLYWNETLRRDSYKSKLDFTRWIEKENLNFHPMDSFGKAELEERHRLLFDIISRIWH